MTQKEIAKQLNISQAAVSRALAGYSNVSEELQKAIRELSERNGYQPNFAGRALRCRKSNVIAALLPSLRNRFHMELFQGLQKAFHSRGYLLYLAVAENEADLHDTVNQLKQLQVAGLVAPGWFAPALLKNRPADSPLLFFSVEEEMDIPFTQIIPEREKSSFEIVSLMIARGRRRIAYLGPNEPRFHGYRHALEAGGLTFSPRYVIHCFDDLAHGNRAMKRLLKLPQRPDAVFCHNDELALGAKWAMDLAGVAVPQEIALAGFDNIDAGQYLSPPLTSVEQPKDRIIQAITDEMLAAIANPDHHAVIRIPCRIIQRGSL